MTFSKEIREKVLTKFNLQCANYAHSKCQWKKGLTFHHVVSNTKVNIKLYGNNKIQSEENALPLCVWCHEHQLQIDWIQTLKKELLAKWKLKKK